MITRFGGKRKSQSSPPYSNPRKSSKYTPSGRPSAAMDKKLDNILAVCGELKGRLEVLESQPQAATRTPPPPPTMPALPRHYVEVDDSEDEAEFDEQIDYQDTYQEEVFEGYTYGRPDVSHSSNRSRGHQHQHRGGRSRGRGGQNDRGRQKFHNKQNQNHHRQRYSEGSYDQNRGRGGRGRPGGRPRGGSSSVMTAAMRKEVMKIVNFKIQDEKFQDAKVERQLIIEGVSSQKDDTKATELNRVLEKMKTVMNDFQPSYIKRITRFTNPSLDGTYPMLVTLRTKKLVGAIFDFIEDQPENLWPWLQPSRTRDTRRRNAESKQRFQHLNTSLPDNSATVWEEFQVGVFHSHRRVPNKNYKAPIGQAQVTPGATANQRPTSSDVAEDLETSQR